MLDDAEICEAVAVALTADGLKAESAYTGGGIWCVTIAEPTLPEAEWLCGMADTNWGGGLTHWESAEVYGEAEGEALQLLYTDVASDSQDVAAIAGALARAVRAWRTAHGNFS